MSAQPETFWKLRPMEPADLPRVFEIEQQAYRFPWTEGIIRDCLRVGYSSWVVMRGPRDVVAYAFMSVAAFEAHILNLCVDPAFQRQGLGRFLLRHLTGIARAAGAEMILLEVRKSNAAALALYRGFGFHRLGVRKGYYPDDAGREDGWLLGYNLKPGGAPS